MQFSNPLQGVSTRIQAIVFLLSCITILSGCLAHAINVRNAERYYQAAVTAEDEGDLEAAREYYRRSIINAEMGNAPPEGKAYAYYNYGRVLGFLCKPKEAKEAMLKSLEYLNGNPGIAQDLRPPNFLELARLYFDTGEIETSLPYYEEGIHLVRPKGIENSDPIGFSLVLQDYAQGLRMIGQDEKAKTLEKEIEELRNGNPGKKAGFVPTRYNENCPN